jgi:hypothetical protein
MANRKPVLFREVNENMKDVLCRLQAEEPTDYLCECPLQGCSERVTLMRAEYDVVRRIGGFLVAPDCRRWPRELLRTQRYVVVRDFGPWVELVTEASRAEPAVDRESSPTRRLSCRATARPAGVGQAGAGWWQAAPADRRAPPAARGSAWPEA